MDGVIRVAAVGDVHFGVESAGRLRPHLEHLPSRADVLLLAGDLTQHGRLAEAEVLARELERCGVPMIAVLGNHDYHGGEEVGIRERLERSGVKILEGECVVLDVRGRRLGVAGVKGFGGGFAGACAAEFGEPEMKQFIQATKRVADRLANCLRSLECDTKVALLHYAPIKGTLAGERLEVYPFLGSYLLGDAIDHGGCHAALHGHAHMGTEWGVTPGGVPVRNVAAPVIKHSYRVYVFSPAPASAPASAPALAPG